MPTLSGPHNTSAFKKGLWWKIVISAVILTTLGLFFGRYCVAQNLDWYTNLRMPFFAPAAWLPKVLWIVVYILMGGSLGIIWHINAVKQYPIIKKFSKVSIIIFLIHLVFNYAYPTLLFGMGKPVLALINILILIAFVIVLIRRFFRLDRVAAFLLTPYLIWLVYATALNIAVIVLN